MGLRLWTVLHPMGAREVAPYAQRVAAEGWDGLMVPDNQNLWGDTFVSMALAATATDDLLVANCATNPATRHPAVVASAAAWVNHASGGRAGLGIARGDSALAHLGSAPTSVASFERYLGLVRRYLAGETIPFAELEPWRVAAPIDDVPLARQPDGSRLAWLDGTPGATITVFATGPRMIAVAARLADRLFLMLGADRDRLRWAIATARRACEEAGRDPAELTLAAGMSVGVAGDQRTARAMVLNTVASSARFSAMHGTVVGPASDADRATYAAIARAYDMSRHNELASQIEALDAGFVDRFAVVGTPERCTERLLELRDLGLDELLLGLPYNDVDPALIDAGHAAFRGEVMPALRRA